MIQEEPVKEAVILQEIGKRFGSHWVLRHLSLTLQAGETVALFGKNGSGKSTLLRIISTLMSPTAGRFQIFGFDGVREVGEIRPRLRLLSHSKQLYGALTVEENFRLIAGIRGVPPEESLLKRLGMYEVRYRQVGELSEGMKKRVVLACLLTGAARARLVLLDEPHPALDLEGKKVLDELIRDWKKEGKTLILASHDHDLVLSHVDRLLILEGGRLSYDGIPKKL